jgi:hypothetical protein
LAKVPEDVRSTDVVADAWGQRSSDEEPETGKLAVHKWTASACLGWLALSEPES